MYTINKLYKQECLLFFFPQMISRCEIFLYILLKVLNFSTQVGHVPACFW